MFSGTREEVKIQARSADTTLMVLGGPVGPLLAQTKKYGELTRTVLDLASKHLSKDDRKMIDKIGIEYFISALIVEYKSGKLPEGTSKGLVKFYSGLPSEFKKILLDKFAIEDFGVGSLSPELDRGHQYAVVGYQPGKLVQIEVIDTKFNWTTLWNILNFGMGVPVDIWTGAWLKLTPSHLDVAVDKPMPTEK